MSYLLGIDLGATTVTAAVLRAGSATAEPVALGGGAGLPAVLVATPAGDLLCGEPARRRAPAEPDRVARGFLHRVGDPTPLSLGGVGYRAEDLCARLVRVVVDEVGAGEGAAPSRIGLTHPAGWGRHKRDLLAGALARRGLAVSLVAAPQAVALAHRGAAPRTGRSGPLVVVDVGGTGTGVTVLDPVAPGLLPAVSGRSADCRAGGADVDDAVFGFVRGSGPAVTAAVDALDPDDPQVLAALTGLRDDCRAAKEILSRDTETAVPVRLPGLRTSVRLHRCDLDELARPVLEPITGPAGDALAEHPDAEVMLAGGTARMPVAVQLLSAALGRPVTVAADPVHGAARGAALSVEPGAGTSRPDARVPDRSGARAPEQPGGAAVPDGGPRDAGRTAPGRRGRHAADGDAVRIPAPREAPGAPVAPVAAAWATARRPSGPAARPAVPPVAAPRSGAPGTRVPVPRSPERPTAARVATPPPLPAPDTLVTRDTARPVVHPHRARILVGAGGLAGVLAVAGALLFWPTASPSLGELSAAPVLPDAATAPAAPTPVPPVTAGATPAPAAGATSPTAASSGGDGDTGTATAAPRTAEPGPAAGPGAAVSAPAGPGIPGARPGAGPGARPGAGPGAGPGSGPGSGPASGPGSGSGSGSGQATSGSAAAPAPDGAPAPGPAPAPNPAPAPGPTPAPPVEGEPAPTTPPASTTATPPPASPGPPPAGPAAA